LNVGFAFARDADVVQCKTTTLLPVCDQAVLTRGSDAVQSGSSCGRDVDERRYPLTVEHYREKYYGHLPTFTHFN